MKIASTPLAASALAVSSAVSPAPTTSTRRSSSSPRVRWASSTATEGIDIERSEIPVSERARLPAASAARKSRLRIGPVAPSTSASS